MNQRSRNCQAICVFSELAGLGGVQESGRIAWKGVADYVRSQQNSAALLVYGGVDEADLALADAGALATPKRWSLLSQVVLKRWKAPLVCFWHLDLLNILPLLRSGSAETVVFLHGIEAWREQRWLIQKLLGRVDRFLTNSQYTWDRFLSFQPQLAHKPHQMVPLGIGRLYEGEPPTPDRVPTVLMLGRLARSEDYKGHRQIIAAWAGVQKLIPDARLWIAGDGDLRPDLEALAQRCGVADAVHFWGRVTEERKQELLEQCRCLAMPSRAEGFGLVYLEAMRLGRPCLVSPHDAAREVVKPPVAGLAVDPALLEPLVDALARLMTEGPEWQQFSRDARLAYEREFTAEKFQSRLVAALFKVKSTNET